jgi:ABC-type multidrug transport system fused ATPase/permease subunit
LTTHQVQKREDKPKQRLDWKTIRRVLGYVSHFWELKVVMVLIVIATIIDVLTPAIIGSIIDIVREVAEGNPIQPGTGIEGLAYGILSPIARWVTTISGYELNTATLLVFSLSLIAISVLTGTLNFLQRYSATIISQKASFDLRGDMYNSLLEQSFSFYDKQRTGQLMARATGDINMLGRFFSMGLRMFVSSSLLLLMVLYSLISINVELALVSVIALPFILQATRTYSQRIGPLWRTVREQNGVITSVLQENLSGIRVIRGFSRESYEEEKFYAECEDYFDINVKMASIRAFFMPLASFLSSLGIVLIIWYGGGQVMRGALSLGSMVAFYFYMAKLMGPIRRIGFITSMFVRASAASERVFEIIDAEVEVHDRDDAEEIEAIDGRLTFADVWFSYDGSNMVLKDIDLDVRSGETIAILGATGSGKSSIINLIPRFYDVTQGSIKVDGKDIRDIKIKSLREQIGIVRQEPFIFSTTLRENIAYGVQNARLDDIVEATKRAKIHGFIDSLPDGYDTRVGERGVTLSGGQKQRVAIARALLKNPKILILDDSTSSVDTQTEYEIQQALDELLKDRTTFILTQRLSSIKNADYIIVLEDGSVTEEGRHDELMAMNGTYRTLYETQLSDVEEGREN